MFLRDLACYVYQVLHAGVDDGHAVLSNLQQAKRTKPCTLPLRLIYSLLGDQSIQDRISVLFFSVAFLTFMSIAAVPAFIEDKLLFVKERMNGAYRCLSSHLYIRNVS